MATMKMPCAVGSGGNIPNEYTFKVIGAGSQAYAYANVYFFAQPYSKFKILSSTFTTNSSSKNGSSFSLTVGTEYDVADFLDANGTILYVGETSSATAYYGGTAEIKVYN